MQPEEYRKMAEVEDRMWYYRALHRHVARSLAAAGLPANAAVLDAGCGTGGLLRYLQAGRPNGHFTGSDLSPLACTLARERTGATIAPGSVTALPLSAAQFDAVVSCDVLCQIEEPATALREFSRVLRPGGLVVVNVPAYQWLWSYHDEAVQSKHRFTRPELKRLCAEQGWQIRQATYWNTLPFPLAVLRRKIFPPADPTSDVRLYPAPLEAMFNAMMSIEHTWLRTGGRLPYGSSVLVVARKPDHA